MAPTISQRTDGITDWIFVGIGLFAVLFTSFPFVISLWKHIRRNKQQQQIRGVHSDDYFAASATPRNQEREYGRRVHLLVQGVIPLASLSRVIDIISVSNSGHENVLTQAPNSQPFYEIVLGGLPGYLLCACYLVLPYFWAAIYTNQHSSSQQLIKNAVYNWLISADAIFLIWIILLVSMAVFPNHEHVVHSIEACYASLLALAVGLAFAVWGLILILTIRKKQESVATLNRELARRILVTLGSLSALCSFIFLVRSVLVLLNQFVFKAGSVGLYVSHWFLYVFCEFISACILCLILNASTRFKTEGRRINAFAAAGYGSFAKKSTEELPSDYDRNSSQEQDSDDEQDIMAYTVAHGTHTEPNRLWSGYVQIDQTNI